MLKKYIENLENISCNICSKNSTEILCDSERNSLPLKTVICNNCGLIYLNPRPTKKLYDEFYKADYRKSVSGTDEGIDKIFYGQIKYCDNKIIPICKKYINFKIKNILDIGASYGGMLKSLGNNYPDANLYGLEPMIKNVQYASKKTGANIDTCLLENYDSKTKFDLITFARTLNHSLEPKENLTKIHKLLSDEGVLIIVLHDFISELSIKPFESITQITHPFNFYKESIQYLLDQVGFEIIYFFDNTIDNPTKKEMKKISISNMIILVKKKSDEKFKISKPNVQEIKKRIENNQNCKENYGYIYKKWRKPNFWLKVYRKLMKVINLW
jgi:2-polyprenyl-3-methyl-5-hydroxy-6-metoxy-1,4-benzoquinol methylase